MSSRTTGVFLAVLAFVVLAGCSSQADESAEAPDFGDSGAEDAFDAPPGPVTFDFRAGKNADEPAVEAYVAWQRAATTSIRGRELTDAVMEGASDAPIRTVERSIVTVEDDDYTVPRAMIGRLESVRSTSRAAILGVCLWSPSFDYQHRESGRTAVDGTPHWMGVEVRMTRQSGHDGAWDVSGMTAGENCKGSRP